MAPSNISNNNNNIIIMSSSEEVDVSKLSPQEQKIYKLYGKLPTRQQILKNKLNTSERKFFDSGDYALNKAGFKDDVGTGGVSNRHLTPGEILRINRGSVSSAGTAGPAGRRLSVSSGLERESTQDEGSDQQQK
jgi:hypothetical protein